MLHLRPRRAVQPQSIPVSLVLGHPDRRSPSRRVLQSSTGSPTAALPLLYSGQSATVPRTNRSAAACLWSRANSKRWLVLLAPPSYSCACRSKHEKSPNPESLGLLPPWLSALRLMHSITTRAMPCPRCARPGRPVPSYGPALVLRPSVQNLSSRRPLLMCDPTRPPT
jgi:hypothetical protein